MITIRVLEQYEYTTSKIRVHYEYSTSKVRVRSNGQYEYVICELSLLHIADKLYSKRN